MIESLKGKKVFVTGADGFIGSHLVEQLVQHGCQVKALSLYNSLNSWGWLEHLPESISKSVEICQGDIRDAYQIREQIRGSEVVFHLAALIAIPYSYHAPSSYVQTNVVGTLNVLQASLDLGVEKFVQTSTSEVYGTAQVVPITENHPMKGQSPYAATKIGADELALSFYRSFKLPVTVLRPFNTYGPRQSARAVIPNIIIQALEGKSKIKLGFTSSTRDFSYVLDTARGFMAVASTPESDGEAINLGTQFEISISDLLTLIGEVMGKNLEIETDSSRLRPEKSEVERLCASNEKAKKLLGWAPEFGGRDGLKAGLTKTVEWLSEPSNLKLYKAQIYNL